jgi:spore coat protein U-like protein
MSWPSTNRSRVPRVRACLALAVLAAFVCPAAHAVVLGACTVTATAVAFGTYTPLATATSTGTISVACTLVVGSSTATAALSSGMSGTFTARTMSNGTGGTLRYNLYTTAADSVVWGDGTGGSQTQTLTINGLGSVTVNATVYGLVPLQDPAPGSYSDTITVTVNY